MQEHLCSMITHVKYLLYYFTNSEHLKNRENYWETRYEDLEKQNDDLINCIAQFSKLFEVSVTCIGILYCVSKSRIRVLVYQAHKKIHCCC